MPVLGQRPGTEFSLAATHGNHAQLALEGDETFQDQADLARLRAERLDYVGVFALELFLVDGQLLANEMAPRVHNSGHWTIEGAGTSQFENHLRAICGLPLGSTAARGHSAMLNLISTMPERAALLAEPGLHLHDYGKEPRPGRKLGHITIVESTARKADQRAARLLRKFESRKI